jgi:hypothetical protein
MVMCDMMSLTGTLVKVKLPYGQLPVMLSADVAVQLYQQTSIVSLQKHRTYGGWHLSGRCMHM